MKKNRDTLGAQYRQRPDKDHLLTTDISTGKTVVLSATCNCCGENRVYSEFYWVKSKQRNGKLKWVRKPICVDCWNEDTSTRSAEKGYNTKEYKHSKMLKLLEELMNRSTLEEFFV